MKYLKTFNSIFEISNTERLDDILDKISKGGVDSLSDLEKKFLDQKSSGNVDDELEELLSIESGHIFSDYFPELGINITFKYERVEDDGGEDEWRIDGEVTLSDNNGNDTSILYGFIYMTYDGDEYSHTLLYCDRRHDYIEFDPKLEKELDRFFSMVGSKISQIF